LLLLFSSKGIFGFVQIKKTEKVVAQGMHQCLSRLLAACAAGSSGSNCESSASFDLSWVLFLFEWRVYGGSALFDPKLLFYSFFLFLFFLGLRVGHAKNHTNPSIYFFF
jgi:hypothetical protein